MEQGLLVLAGSLAGFGVGLISRWIERRWGKIDKQAERDGARSDKHADDLRAAYAEFFGAVTAFFDRSALFLGLKAAIDKHADGDESVQQGAYAGIPVKDLELRMQQARLDLIDASTFMTQRGISVILLESDAQKRKAIKDIAMRTLLLWHTKEQRAAYAADIKGAKRRIGPVDGATCRRFRS